MAGPFTFHVKRVMLKYPHGIQADDSTAPAQTVVILDNDPSDNDMRQGSWMTLNMPGDQRADFIEGEAVTARFTLITPAERAEHKPDPNQYHSR